MLAGILILQTVGGVSAEAPERVLEVGRVVRDSIQASDPITSTPTLNEKYSPISVRAKNCRLSVPESGRYYMDLRSRYFDTYLVVRDSEGTLLAEDDDGWMISQSRLTVDLKSNEIYLVYACALHGGIGEFELAALKGDPPAPTDEERAEWMSDPRAMASRHRWEGTELFGNGNLVEAQPLLEKALGIAEEKLPGETQELAACLYELGRLFSSKNEFAKASAFLKRALRVQEDLLGSEDFQTCETYLELGRVDSKQGDFRSAKPLFAKALEGFRRCLPPEENKAFHNVLSRCAEVAFCMGEWASSEDSYRRCLPLAAKWYGEESALVANHLTMLGNCRLLQGDSKEAKRYYEQAQTVQERQGRSHDLITTEIRRRLAAIVMKEGNYDYAERLLKLAFKDSEETAEPNSPTIAFLLRLLGAVYHVKGNYVEGKEACEKALYTFERSLGKESFYAMDCRIQLAQTEIELLNLSEAAQLLETARAQNERNTDRMYPSSKVEIEQALGKMWFFLGDFEKAEAEWTAANAFYNLSLLALERNDLPLAWNYASRAFSMAEENIGGLINTLSESERWDYVLSQRRALDALVGVAHRSDDPHWIAACFDALSAWKARIFRGMLSTKRTLYATADPEARRMLEDLRSVQSRISLLASCDPEDAPFVEQELVVLQERRIALERTLARLSSPDRGESVADWRNLKKTLPPGASFINFLEHRYETLPVRKEGRAVENSSWSAPYLSAFILTSESESPVSVRLGPSGEIENLLGKYLSELVAHKPSRNWLQNPNLIKLNDEVFEKIWTPLAEHLDGDLVILSVDGCLGGLPFGVLRGKHGRYLIEDYRFLYLQDIASLKPSTNETSRPSGDLLVVGGVDYRSAAPGARSLSEETLSAERGLSARLRRAWSDLPGTLAEAEAISELHRGAFPGHAALFLSGDAPTEERLKEELPKVSFVHIASHGFFAPETGSFWEQATAASRPEKRLPGLLSGIVCAGANLSVKVGRDNGLLTAEEAGWLDLSRCDLVVLSACETGLGAVRGGEGIVGLRSAFRQAGAKTAISSLWSVGDRSTRELMEVFYRALWIEKMDKLEAFRTAQLQMLSRQRQEYRGETFPYALGAFVLDGEYR